MATRVIRYFNDIKHGKSYLPGVILAQKKAQEKYELEKEAILEGHKKTDEIKIWKKPVPVLPSASRAERRRRRSELFSTPRSLKHGGPTPIQQLMQLYEDGDPEGKGQEWVRSQSKLRQQRAKINQARNQDYEARIQKAMDDFEQQKAIAATQAAKKKLTYGDAAPKALSKVPKDGDDDFDNTDEDDEFPRDMLNVVKQRLQRKHVEEEAKKLYQQSLQQFPDFIEDARRAYEISQAAPSRFERTEVEMLQVGESAPDDGDDDGDQGSRKARKAKKSETRKAKKATRKEKKEKKSKKHG